MSEKPIIFSTPMVRAILDGRKTQTRRLRNLKDQPIYNEKHHIWRWKTCRWSGNSVPEGDSVFQYAPWKIGDILWVREPWGHYMISGGGARPEWKKAYKADEIERYPAEVEWKSAMFMPRKFARIFLFVNNVRLERLQHIDGMAIFAEGVGSGEFLETLDDRADFRDLWDSLRTPADREKYGWAANPWVWVIHFMRIKKSEE